jgi:hypothetical protein
MAKKKPRKFPKLTRSQLAKQRIDFAYGNAPEGANRWVTKRSLKSAAEAHGQFSSLNVAAETTLDRKNDTRRYKKYFIEKLVPGLGRSDIDEIAFAHLLDRTQSSSEETCGEE